MKLFLLIILFSPMAFAGPGDGGGGGLDTLSRDEISQQVSHLKNRLALAFHRFEYFFAHAEGANEPADLGPNKGLPQALADVIRDGKMQSVIQSVRIETTDKDCFDPKTGEKKDASMWPDGHMCVSLSRLAVWPRESFEREFLALGAHEVSHARGAGETQARSVQQAFLQSPLLSFDFKALEQAILQFRRNYVGVYSDWVSGKKGSIENVSQLRDASRDIQNSMPLLVHQLLASEIHPFKVSAQSVFGDSYDDLAEMALGHMDREYREFTRFKYAPDVLVRTRAALQMLSDFQQINPTRAAFAGTYDTDLTLMYDLFRINHPNLKSSPVKPKAPVREGNLTLPGIYRIVEDLSCTITSDQGVVTVSQIRSPHPGDSAISAPIELRDENDRLVKVHVGANALLNVGFKAVPVMAWVRPVEETNPSNIVLLGGDWTAQDATSARDSEGTAYPNGDKLYPTVLLDLDFMPKAQVDFAISSYTHASQPKHRYRLNCALPNSKRESMPSPVLKRVPRDD